MIDRYSRKELKNIWSEENKYKIWLDIEIAAAEAMEKYKIIPRGVAAIVKKKSRISKKTVSKKINIKTIKKDHSDSKNDLKETKEKIVDLKNEESENEEKTGWWS